MPCFPSVSRESLFSQSAHCREDWLLWSLPASIAVGGNGGRPPFFPRPLRGPALVDVSAGPAPPAPANLYSLSDASSSTHAHMITVVMPRRGYTGVRACGRHGNIYLTTELRWMHPCVRVCVGS